MNCPHENFEAFVDVNRIKRGEEGEVYAWMCDITVRCRDCLLPFTFPGFANGISSVEGRVSITGEKLVIPIKPKDQEHFEFFPGFNVKHTA